LKKLAMGFCRWKVTLVHPGSRLCKCDEALSKSCIINISSIGENYERAKELNINCEVDGAAENLGDERIYVPPDTQPIPVHEPDRLIHELENQYTTSLRL
jgi:hypothetical protein